MAKINVTLTNAQDGQHWPAEVVTDKPVGWWIDQILDALDLPRELDGQRIRYRFVIESSGQIVSDNDTLEAFGLQEGDVILLERAQQPASATLTQETGALLGTKRTRKFPSWIFLGWVVAVILITIGLFTRFSTQKDLHNETTWSSYPAEASAPETEDKTWQVVVYGADVSAVSLNLELVNGRNINSEYQEILLCKNLARKMKLMIGDEINIYLPTIGGTKWVIVGVVSDIDWRKPNFVFVNKDVLNQIMNSVGTP